MTQTKRFLFFDLAALAFILLAAVLVIWADFSIQTGDLAISVGSFVVVAGMFMAYILLNIKVLDDEPNSRLARVLFTLAAIFPAGFVAARIGLTSDTIARLTLIIIAGLLGTAVSRNWNAVALRGVHLAWLYKVDGIRLGLAVSIVGIMSMIYVSMPAMVITFSQ
jgi:hypothetical protein